MSPEDRMAKSKSQEDEDAIDELPLSPPFLRVEAPSPVAKEHPSVAEDSDVRAIGRMVEPTSEEVDESTRLLGNYHNPRICGLRNCNHGTFSPSADSDNGVNGHHSSEDDDNDDRSLRGSYAESFIANTHSNTMRRLSTQVSEFKNRKLMYISYYIPFIKWIRQYEWQWFRGDLIAALTMASFYIPMSLSYASNLAHIPPVNGLYSFVFNPLIYAFLGTCPQMVVGPEAPGSLLVGQVVRTSIDRGSSGDDDDAINAQIAGVVTGIAGAIIFIAGLTRLGFLDSVLSRPFLRGFISAIGFVILVDQAIPELGLGDEAANSGGVAHGSCAQKLVFLVQNISKSQSLTAAVSLGAFAIIMAFR